MAVNNNVNDDKGLKRLEARQRAFANMKGNSTGKTGGTAFHKPGSRKK